MRLCTHLKDLACDSTMSVAQGQSTHRKASPDIIRWNSCSVSRLNMKNKKFDHPLLKSYNKEEEEVMCGLGLLIMRFTWIYCEFLPSEVDFLSEGHGTAVTSLERCSGLRSNPPCGLGQSNISLTEDMSSRFSWWMTSTPKLTPHCRRVWENTFWLYYRAFMAMKFCVLTWGSQGLNHQPCTVNGLGPK